MAKHLSALRGLAEALGVDAQLRTVRSARVARGEPSALAHDEWARLLRMPDRRTRHGKRDLKRGRTRAVPLDDDALDAIVAWVKVRPAALTEQLLLSLPRSGQPGGLSTRDIARIVGRHAAAADLPEDRRSPHVLRHTFCTHLADAGADTAVIRELAGHADIRTTTVYTAINTGRLEHVVAERTQRARGARRAAASR